MMTRSIASSALLATLVATFAGCGGGTEQGSATPPQAPVAAVPLGTLAASPNPIQVCDGSGLGLTRISWTGPAGELVEVRVGRPDGGLFARTSSDGSKETGKWVGNNSLFYLRRVGPDGKAGDTIATVAVGVTTEGCK